MKDQDVVETIEVPSGKNSKKKVVKKGNEGENNPHSRKEKVRPPVDTNLQDDPDEEDEISLGKRKGKPTQMPPIFRKVVSLEGTSTPKAILDPGKDISLGQYMSARKSLAMVIFADILKMVG